MLNCGGVSLCAELLPRVLQLQQMDKVDIEGALPLYRALLEGYSATAGTGSASPSSGKVWADYDEPAALAALRGYLTAMTAKDCGIMITLQPLQQASGGTSPPVSPSKVPSSTQQAAADAAIAPSGAAQQQIAAAWPEPEEAVGAAGSLLHPAPKLINIHGTGSSSESCFMYRVRPPAGCVGYRVCMWRGRLRATVWLHLSCTGTNIYACIWESAHIVVTCACRSQSSSTLMFTF